MSYQQAREEILNNIAPLPSQELELTQASGRILAEDVYSPLDLPLFNNSAMDGFALRVEDCQGASPDKPIKLPLMGRVEAGQEILPEIKAGEAYRIYTGAPIPPGADTVIPFEKAHSYNDAELELTHCPSKEDCFRMRGEELKSGTLVFEQGIPLRPAAIGLLATLGYGKISVRPKLRVAIHSSGNELVDLPTELKAGQIRNSNLYALAARVESWGAEPLLRPILRDSPEAVREGLEETLSLKPDAILTTGGISAGDLDFIREVASEWNPSIQVRRVNMKPGKPLVDGQLAGIPFFGLPGNPAACLVSFEVFVRPALAKLEGRQDGLIPQRAALLMEDLKLKAIDRVQFLRASVYYDHEAGTYFAQARPKQGSHMLSNFAAANALLEIPAQSPQLQKGSRVNAHLLELS